MWEDKQFKRQVDLLGYERAMKEVTPDLREELVRAFATGLPKEGSRSQFTAKCIRGMSVAEGGDVIVKDIRVRHLHLRGWIEKQKYIKVRAVRLILHSVLPHFDDGYQFCPIDHSPGA